MLVIGPPADAAYYWEKGARTRWLGRGVSGLDVSPEPSPRELQQLLHGVDDNGEARWPTASRRRRLGHDLVFAAPKAVSLIWALGAPDVAEAVRAAHDTAVDGAFDYLERVAAWVRRGPGGQLMPVRGLLAAAFQHRVSRAGDPHLHTHVVVANAACDLNGVWSSLDGRWLFAEHRAAGALYQAALRYHLDASGLSLRWSVRADGLGVVGDVEDAAVAEFSQRRRQLVAAAAARGGDVSSSRRVAGLVGRPPRPDPPSASGTWTERARKVGFDATRFSLKPQTQLDAAATQPSVDGLLGARGVTARRSIFTRRDLVQVVASQLPCGALPSTVESSVDAILASQAVVRVTPHQDGVARPRFAPRYTTSEVLALEDRLVADVRRSAHLGGVVVMRARPGPATWAALDAARKTWPVDAPGRRVLALVPSTSEARDLEAATGFDTHLLDGRLPGGPPAVVIVPGAQRLGPRAIAAVLDHTAARGDTLVLIDGSRRPMALEGRDLLSRLPALSFTESMDGDRCRASRLDRLERSHGSVTLCADSESRHQAAVEDWARAGGQGRLEARHRADVDDLNRRARALLAPRGPCVTAGGLDFCPGEPVIVRRTNATLGVTCGRIGIVTEVDPHRHQLHIDFAGDSKPVRLDVRRVSPGVLAHAYAVPTACRAPSPGPTYTLDVRRPTGGRDVHHYVVAAPDLAEGRPRAPANRLDPLVRLAAAAGSPPPGPEHRTEAELVTARSLLASRLRAGLPPGGADPRVIQATLADAVEERDAARHWATARVPGASARLADAEEALHRQRQRAARLDAWVADHHPELRELAGLDEALARRAELLDRAAELVAHPRPHERGPLRPLRAPAVRGDHLRSAGICLP